MTQISLKKGKKDIYERQGQSSKDEVSRLKKKSASPKKKSKNRKSVQRATKSEYPEHEQRHDRVCKYNLFLHLTGN